MNFVQIMDTTCPCGILSIVKIIRWVINAICLVVPIILIVLSILDVAKIVTAGNIDDKLKKEVTGRITTRLIFAVIIFLVPTIVMMLFDLIPVSGKDATVGNVTWQTCWKEAKDTAAISCEQ